MEPNELTTTRRRTGARDQSLEAAVGAWLRAERTTDATARSTESDVAAEHALSAVFTGLDRAVPSRGFADRVLVHAGIARAPWTQRFLAAGPARWTLAWAACTAFVVALAIPLLLTTFRAGWSISAAARGVAMVFAEAGQWLAEGLLTWQDWGITARMIDTQLRSPQAAAAGLSILLISFAALWLVQSWSAEHRSFSDANSISV